MTAPLTSGSCLQHPFLHGCSEDFLKRISAFARIVSFQKGQVVLQEGEYADRCYLISRGQVQLLAGAGEGARQSGASPVLIQTLGAGDVLGWSWLFPPFEWHFSAVATEPCDAIELNAAFLLTAAEKDPVFGYELLKRVSMQLVQRLQATRARLAEAAQKRRRGKP